MEMEAAMSESKVLNTQEVADRLRVKVITVQRWLHAGKLRGTKLPGRAGWRIPIDEVERMERGEAVEGKVAA
jgi:excisionase family DNA binding protein